MNRAQTIKQLRDSGYQPRTVKQEMRANLIRAIESGEDRFPGIVGYDKTALPQIENALLSGHDFILLGLRGQAKTRILRQLYRFLDEWVPAIEGCEINDDPMNPLCPVCQRKVAMHGDEVAIRWIPRDLQWVNFPAALSRGSFGIYFANSGIVSVLVTAANVLFCSLAGYGLAKFRFPLRDFCFRTILCTLMLPLEIVLVPTFLVVQQLGMVNSLTGIIVPLGMWVLGEACRQLHAWREADPVWAELTMSVNLSPKLFAQQHLVRDIVAELKRAGLPPRLLKLELTEGILVHHPQAANAMLKQLRALGIGVAIDDFGTGYSSLSYLTSLNVDVLKIDRSFIHKLSGGAEGGDGDGAEVVRNIVRLAAGLGLAVVAEGVETLDQRDQLDAMNCEFVQGFHFSRPVDAATVWESLLRNP